MTTFGVEGEIERHIRRSEIYEPLLHSRECDIQTVVDDERNVIFCADGWVSRAILS